MPEPSAPLVRSTAANLPASGKQIADSGSHLNLAVEELAKRVAEDATHPKAEVLMPPEHQLQVRLVKLDDVLRVQEAGSDEGIAAGAFWALSGALLGIGVNLVTGDATTISKASWVAITGTSFFLVCAGLLWLRFSRRTREAKRQLGANLTHG